VRRELPYKPSQLVLKALPDSFPIVFLGGTGSHQYLATSFEEISSEEAYETILEMVPDTSQDEIGKGFGSGIIGVISYDDYSGEVSPQPSRFLRVYASIGFELQSKTAWYFSEPEIPETATNWPPEDLLSLFESELADPHPTSGSNIHLAPQSADEAYRKLVEQALKDIRSGRFYQINLLRYFTVPQAPATSAIIDLLHHQSGPFGALLQLEGLTIASFSPERFLSIDTPGTPKIHSFPIKGTSTRYLDPNKDLESAKALETSEKDRAELHIIIDLMRNDLTQVCQKKSVTVEDPGSLQSFVNVHHLIGHVSGLLRSGLTLRELLLATAPGGSITGAPKIEVMQAIREAEGRSRGYFMGNLFSWDPRIGFDSSILIRTLVKVGANPYEFAAGSGIVVHSQPHKEQAEIDAKCRVVTEAY
jgi:para-aminobenzoate synthetase component 1